jgi:hypothetical protein
MERTGLLQCRRLYVQPPRAHSEKLISPVVERGLGVTLMMTAGVGGRVLIIHPRLPFASNSIWAILDLGI